MQNAIAFSDNDVIVIAWSYGHKLEGCMGFAVYRIDAAGMETPLPSMAVFPGFSPTKGQTTASFPVQKFYWKDPYARLVAEKTGSRKFRYKIVPLEGVPGSLKPMTIGFVVSNEIAISAAAGAQWQASFNRGLISTQSVSRALGGKPAKASLLAAIAKKDGPLRTSLAGDMIATLLAFTARAQAGGKLYAALYELGDDELISALEAAGKKLHLVLANPKASDGQSASGSTDGNAASRKRLGLTAGELVDRMLGDNQIGHNKFVVHVDAKGKPRAVLFGSTNWTSTGLCGQTNNTIVCEHAPLAARYLAYWKKLALDTKVAGPDPKALQAAPLRTWDATPQRFSIGGGAHATSWFSPNTPKLRAGLANEKRPPDMEELAQLIAGAKHAVLFLALYPGTPSVANWAGQAQKANKDLFVRGCVTHPSAAEAFYYELHGTTPPPKAGSAARQDPRVIQAQALSETIPAGWAKEDPVSRLCRHPRQDRRCRSVLGELRRGDRQPQPRPQGVVQQRREPRHHPRPACPGRGLRHPRARHLRPLLVALDRADPGAGRRQRHARGQARCVAEPLLRRPGRHQGGAIEVLAERAATSVIRPATRSVHSAKCGASCAAPARPS